MKKKNYRKLGSEEAKRQHRLRFPFCQICLKRNCKIEAHHLLTTGAWPQMSNQDYNLISLCVHCHSFGKISFHGSGTDLMKEKFDAKFPNRMAKLREIAITRNKVDYKKEYEDLKGIDID